MPHIPLRSRLLNIKSLMVLLAFFVAFITLINGFYASYKVQRNQLLKHTLDTNHAYAQKLATGINSFLITTYQQLAYSASVLGQSFNDKELLLNESKRLNLQTDTFNSVFIVNNKGIVLAGSPDNLSLIGGKLLEKGSTEAIKTKAPLISTPYLSADNNYILLISFPVFNKSGHYLGYIGGTIHLKEKNILNELLGQHYHQDGSYIYVIDKNKQIIYHPKASKISNQVTDNTVVNQVVNNSSGSAQITDTTGVEMLAGFAPIAKTNWGVIAQRPVSQTLASLNKLMKQVVYRTLPLALFTFIFMWILANYISRPLRQLANTVKNLHATNAQDSLTSISSWYFESQELKNAMLKGLNSINSQICQLKKDADTDPLTGAFNRRSLDLLLEQLEKKQIYFSVLAIDIDHFKKVNDTFGHAAGDKALVKLTEVMNQIARDQDIVARTGGEEFLLILPNTSGDTAQKIAESLRISIAGMHIEPMGSICVSIGIATKAEINIASAEVLNQADQALYQAKNTGRNRSEVYQSENTR